MPLLAVKKFDDFLLVMILVMFGAAQAWFDCLIIHKCLQLGFGHVCEISYNQFMPQNIKHPLVRSKALPSQLQGVLWSVSLDKLDLEKNKSYIINQILSLGTQEELKWLFNNYTLNEIRDTFIKQPAKSYTWSAFNFAKNILLNLERMSLPPEAYVRSLPRNIRSR